MSNFLYDRHRSLVETAYFETMEQLDDETIRKAKQEAEEYNALLSKGISESRSDSEMSMYNDILNVNGDGVMAYIEIPAIDINLPISHGTEAKTLENYVGHVVGSSLPVGGESTHAVISGHSGMAGQRMFSRLVKQLSEKEGVTEALKAENQMLWVQRMNNLRNTAAEIVSSELIYC